MSDESKKIYKHQMDMMEAHAYNYIQADVWMKIMMKNHEETLERVLNTAVVPDEKKNCVQLSYPHNVIRSSVDEAALSDESVITDKSSTIKIEYPQKRKNKIKSTDTVVKKRKTSTSKKITTEAKGESYDVQIDKPKDDCIIASKKQENSISCVIESIENLEYSFHNSDDEYTLRNNDGCNCLFDGQIFVIIDENKNLEKNKQTGMVNYDASEDVTSEIKSIFKFPGFSKTSSEYSTLEDETVTDLNIFKDNDEDQSNYTTAPKSRNLKKERKKKKINYPAKRRY